MLAGAARRGGNSREKTSLHQRTCFSGQIQVVTVKIPNLNTFVARTKKNVSFVTPPEGGLSSTQTFIQSCSMPGPGEARIEKM